MTRAAVLLAVLLPLAAAAQETPPDASAPKVEVTGCLKGSTLTENPARRWRLRGPKTLMKQVKKEAGTRIRITGTTRQAAQGLVVGRTRIGRTDILIGSGPDRTSSRDPLPEQPTIDVLSFEPTGETCR